MRKIVAVFLAAFLCICTMTACNQTDSQSSSGSTAESDVQSKGEPVVIQNQRFDTVGYFVFRAMDEKAFDFYLKSGYDTVEFCDTSWFYKAGSQALENYRKGIKESIELAQKKGLKAYVVLLSTLEQWTGSADSGNGQGQAFDPADKAKMAERLRYIRESVEYFKIADGFSLFAGDPGGVLGIDAPGGLEYYIQMGLDVHKIVKEVAPQASFNLNLWAVAQFVQETTDPFLPSFWLAEGDYGRQIIAAQDVLGSEIGIEIPGHDYYRMLALSIYSSTGQHPDRPFPDKADVEAIKQKGTTRYWAFSHSLMPDISQDVQFNTQRVYYYVNKMREIGMNGVVMGNVTVSQYADLYAYGRFANDSNATVEQVLREYAGFIATEETADSLYEIFKYLNNYDSSQTDLDPAYTLPKLDTSIQNIQQALTMFRTIKPNPEPNMPMLESIEVYLGKIQARLNEINYATRPEDAKDMAAMICSFDDGGGLTPVTSPAIDGCSGKLTAPVALYGLAEGTIAPIDASSYAGYGYVHYDVYAEEDVTTRSYVMLCSDSKSLFSDAIWTYEFGGSIQLKAGWNHVTVKISKGATYGQNHIDWSNITDYRVLFWNDTEKPLTVYLDNLYISNYEENKRP